MPAGGYIIHLMRPLLLDFIRLRQPSSRHSGALPCREGGNTPWLATGYEWRGDHGVALAKPGC